MLTAPYSLFIFLVYDPPPLPFTAGFAIAFIFQAVETFLATSFAISNAANLDNGPGTVDPCSGRQVPSPLATIYRCSGFYFVYYWRLQAAVHQLSVGRKPK